MHYVYRLRSTVDPQKGYTGLTGDLRQRMAQHNRGEVASTRGLAPFDLVFYAAFETRDQAFRFERYLKTGSGHAFALKRLWPQPQTRQ